MKRFLVGLLAVIGAVTLVLVLLAAGLGYWAWRELAPVEPDVPDRLVLELDLRGTLGDEPQAPPWLWLEREPQPDLADTVLTLDTAADDPRVRGLVARLDASAHGLAAAQELRAAITRFRAAGKFAFVHAEDLGGLASGNEGYYLASAFERVVLQPEGGLGLTGLAVEMPFARDLLDRFGVDAEVSRRAEYKTAFESFTHAEPSPANREMIAALLDDAERQWIDGIAQGRRLDAERLRALVDGGPYAAAEALTLGLVDGLGFLDEVREAARERAGPQAEFWSLGRYAAALRARQPEDAIRIALVRAAGMIGSTDGGPGGIDGDALAEVLDQAAEDEQIAAVLLRLDSPGGSPTASAVIARAITRLRERGKPVVVSMVGSAASGGYWIAVAGDRIVAQPGTLTGSIGVIAGKPVLGRLWQDLGVNWTLFARGRHAGIGSINRPYSRSERARVETLVDALYDRFLDVVAGGRDIDRDRVAQLARGRVYTGAQAKNLGLIDALGGVVEAREQLREQLALTPTAPLVLVRYPPPSLDLAGLTRWLDRLPLLGGAGAGLPPGPMLLAPPLRLR